MSLKNRSLILILCLASALPAAADVCPDPLALVSSETSGCARICRGADYECCALVCTDRAARVDDLWKGPATLPSARGHFDGRGFDFEMPEMPALTFEQREQLFASALSALHAFGRAGSLEEGDVEELARLLAKLTGGESEEGPEEG